MHSEKDQAYEQWKQRVAFLSTINSYVTTFFLVLHPLVMVVAYDFWANYHFLLLGHSAQQLLLGCYIWALPDPKYQHWLKQKLWLYFTLCVGNLMLATFGTLLACYFYWAGPALYSFLSAALLVYLLLATAPLLVAIVSSFVLVQTLFYQKPEREVLL